MDAAHRHHLQLIRLSARLENMLTDDEPAKDKFDHIINLRTKEEEKRTPDAFASQVACRPFVSYLSTAMFLSTTNQKKVQILGYGQMFFPLFLLLLKKRNT